MTAHVIDHTSPLLAVDHIGVKAPRFTHRKGANPRHGFTSKRIDKGIIFDCEWDMLAALWKHNSAPCPNIQKRQGVGRAVPNFIHHPIPNAGKMIGACETKAPLNLRVKTLKVCT